MYSTASWISVDKSLCRSLGATKDAVTWRDSCNKNLVVLILDGVLFVTKSAAVNNAFSSKAFDFYDYDWGMKKKFLMLIEILVWWVNDDCIITWFMTIWKTAFFFFLAMIEIHSLHYLKQIFFYIRFFFFLFFFLLFFLLSLFVIVTKNFNMLPFASRLKFTSTLVKVARSTSTVVNSVRVCFWFPFYPSNSARILTVYSICNHYDFKWDSQLFDFRV